MVDLNCKNTSCLAKIEFDDPSELVMIAVGEIWINSSIALVKFISIFYCQKWCVTFVLLVSYWFNEVIQSAQKGLITQSIHQLSSYNMSSLQNG